MFATMMVAMCSTALFTSCGEEEALEGSVEEQFKFGELTAIANPDGTIDISGHIATNTKLKEFALYNEDGSIAYDFLEANDQVKTKNKELDENGKAVKDKFFELDIKSTGKLPVAIYTLRIKTKKAGTFEEGIGEAYKFMVGTGANDTLGSQISLRDKKCFKLGDFYNTEDGSLKNAAYANSIEIYLTSDLKIASAKGLKVATTTNDVRSQEEADAIKAALADAKVYEANKCVITTTDCIATYNIEVIDANAVWLSGVRINSKGTLKIDTSAAFN